MRPEKYTWRRVRSLDDALTVACIRNSCREFMTHDQREIKPEAQDKWWGSLDHDRFRLFLMIIALTPVGFGFLRTDEEAWLTGGLLPEWRGQGLGRQLFDNLCREAADLSYAEACLDVFAWNEPAIRVYEKIGFVRQSDRDGIVLMKKDLVESRGQ